MSPPTIHPPWPYLPLELRALGGFATPHLFRRAMTHWPRGESQAVLVIPGFGQTDASTAGLRQFLLGQGFLVEGWRQSRNLGMRKGLTAALLTQLADLEQQSGHPVVLLGWSLGGIFARELARKAPGLVQRVVSLGSPIAGGQTTTIDAMFRRWNPQPPPTTEQRQKMQQAPPVPCTAIYSRSDGIVAWRAALETHGEQIENIAVRGSHMGMGQNPLVWYACAHRMSPATRDCPFSWPPALRWLAPRS